MQYAEIFLDLSSAGIEGDAEAQHYEKQIELFDWAWGASLEEAAGDGGADSTSQAVGMAISFCKPVDGATTAMLSHLEKATRIPSAVLTLVQRTKQNLMVRVDLKGVVLDSYDLEVDSDDSEVSLSEVWSMSYEEVSIQYKGRLDAGDVRGKAPSLGGSKFTLTTPRQTEMQKADLGEKMDGAGRGRLASAREGKPEAAPLDKQEVFKLIEEYLKKNKTRL